MPNILNVLINYLKYNRVHKVVYIYDHDESLHRIYELIELMNRDAYFINFLLEIRSTNYDDVYSILYNIESHALHKDQLPNYILLDLHSSDEYEKMFQKILHMGVYYIYYYRVCFYISSYRNNNKP